MLPFLKRKHEGSASTPVDPVKRKPDEESEESDYDMLDSAAEDLIKAVHSKNVKAVASALKAAFDMCESQPHEESNE